MNTTFADLGLHATLVHTASELGFEQPTPIQADLIPLLLDGRDAIGQAQTGTGKTAAFGFPLLHRLEPGEGHPQALVVVPTRELATQVASAIYTYGAAMGVRALPIFGGQPYGKQINRLKKGVDVVVGTPGRLIDLIDKGALDLSHIGTVVLDEADEMLSMGFVEDIEKILQATPAERQTAFLSATMPTGIRKLAARYLNDPASIQIEATERTAATIEQRAYLVHGGDKMAALVRLLETEPTESVIVFTHTRASTAELATTLADYGYAAEALSGEMTQQARTETLARFRSKRINILVGTDVAARGLDIDHISHVVNYDLPKDPEVYVHRIGRTGRAGNTGVAVALVRPNQRGLIRRIEKYTKSDVIWADLPSVKDVEAQRMAAFGDKVKAQFETPADPAARDLLLALMAEGYDPMDVAAAALMMARASEPAPPLAEVGRTRQKRDRERFDKFDKQERRPRDTNGREEGMVRLVLDKGRQADVLPGQVVSAIARTADIPGRVLGKIAIKDRKTFVDVPANFVDRVLRQSGGYRLGKDVAQIERAG